MKIPFLLKILNGKVHIMKTALIKDTLRRIGRTKGRFFAIMAIIAIGCGFFAGVKVTSPDMKKTADTYYKERNLMDVRIVSTFGFSDDEVEKISALDCVKGASGGYSSDMFIKMENGTSPIVRVYSLGNSRSDLSPSYINRPVIEEGRMPTAANECLIETSTPEEYSIGDKITLETKDSDDPAEDVLKYTSFTVVGKVSWVRYVDFERGTTTIGNGKVESFLIIPQEAFLSEYYTEVCVTLNGAEELDSFKSEYSDFVEAKKGEIEAYMDDIHADRLAETREELDKAASELEQGEKDYQAALDEYNAKLLSAENDIAEAKAEIEAKEKELADGREAYEYGLQQYASETASLGETKRVLENRSSEYSYAKAALEQSRQQMNSLSAFIEKYSEEPADENDETLDTAVEELKIYDTDGISVSDAAYEYAQLLADAEQKAVLAELLNQTLLNVSETINTEDARLSSAKAEIDYGFSQAEYAQSVLNDTYSQLMETKTQLDEGEAQLEESKLLLEESENGMSGKNSSAKTELDNAKAELDENRRKLEESEADFEKMSSSIKWYMLDRNDNSGYSSFGDDADRVDSIARVFPVFFILVAALVCFNTMTRMVEEQRTEIGTLKALGYGSGSVMAQFLIYAVSASIIGSVLGLAVGFQLFPRVIFNAYTLMYDYPYVICEYRWDYAAGCIGASLLCTGASSVIACFRELNGQPAQLMRPKPPKNGKRVLLERIPFIWKHLSFNIKVTARNIFRYKNRVLMTVIGIGGCTALMLTGFGLRHAISAIVDLQFGEIFNYDAICTFSAESDEELDALRESTDSCEGIADSLFAMQKSVTVKHDGANVEAFAIVPEESGEIGDFITLRNRKTHEPYSLGDDGVIINEKLASLLGAEAGDEISFSDTEQTLKISAVTENYSNNYVYFTPQLYYKVFGDCEFNILYVTKADGADNDAVSEKILENECVMSVNFMEFAGENFRKLIKNLNAIVYVIIASSGALAFVVLYNLANININERMRELATIKVLGFHDGEVGAYVYRENTVSAVLGMLLGLFLGIFLTKFVVRTAEVDVVMFCPDIPVYCFVFAALLTALFTVLVNALLYFKLKSIDMASSMKAIE